MDLPVVPSPIVFCSFRSFCLIIFATLLSLNLALGPSIVFTLLYSQNICGFMVGFCLRFGVTPTYIFYLFGYLFKRI